MGSSATRVRVLAQHLTASPSPAAATDTLTPSLGATPIESGFGAVVEMSSAGSLERLLAEEALADELRRVWQEFGGLVVLRGLQELTPSQLVEVSKIFGDVEGEAIGGRAGNEKNNMVLPDSQAVARLGNTVDTVTGERNASFIDAGPDVYDAEGHLDPQYRPHDTHGKLRALGPPVLPSKCPPPPSTWQARGFVLS